VEGKIMQIVDRISDLLDILAQEKDGCSVSEISERMKLSPSSVHRMLSSLREKNYVVQNTITKKYKIGLKILTLAVKLLNHYDVRAISKKYMNELSSKYDNLVFLSAYQNGLVVCIDTVEMASNMKFYVNIGSKMPLNGAAAAQSIIAFDSDEFKKEIFSKQKYKKYTNSTIDTEEKLKERFNEVIRDGYAICDGELEDGVCAMSAPIRDYTNSVVASLSMTGIRTVDSISRNKINDLIKTALKISNELGYLS
jgi:DNA-binding IclR family transcriptional regulator